jgi:hypothetical protein
LRTWSTGDCFGEPYLWLLRGQLLIADFKNDENEAKRSVRKALAVCSVLRLIKLWLKAPLEERDGDGKRRMVGGKRTKHGTPQGGVASHCVPTST